ncbi:MAG: serine/threonine protein kinase [Deltaproteobacteria bacterium]|nr:serine/threonine protein kinase [Deltaproteobacteria bacterium]
MSPGSQGMVGDGAEMFCPKCGQSFPGDATFCPGDGSRLFLLDDERDPFVGTDLDGRFQIGHRIGRGGMGAVYAATQLSTGRTVAVKVIAPGQAGSRAAAKRFLREAQLSTELSSPHIVTVFDFGRSSDGTLFIAMELIAGRSLGEVLEEQGRFSPERVIAIAGQLCEALTCAHDGNIVHRDLKPANIVLLDRGPGQDFVKVLDFGLAKSLTGDGVESMVLTRTGAVMGTPIYASPEMLSSKRVGPATDLYALGIILYELSTGALPFSATTVDEMIVAHTSKPPAPLPPTVPRGLRELIFQLLAKDPQARPASARQVGERLGTIDVREIGDVGPQPAAGARVGNLPTQGPEPRESPSARRWWWLAVPVVLVLAMGIGLLVAGDDGETVAVLADAAQPAGAAAAAPAPAAAADAARPDASVPDAAPAPPDAGARARKPRPEPRKPRILFVIKTSPAGARVSFNFGKEFEYVKCPRDTKVCRFSVEPSEDYARLQIWKPGFDTLIIPFRRGSLAESRVIRRTFELSPKP